MGYKLPCGEEDRGPTGPDYPFTTKDDCISKQKRQGGGGEAPFAQIQEILQARI
jgi:hypothetical protein